MLGTQKRCWGNQKRCWETRNNGKTKSEGPKLIKNDRANDVRRTRSGQKTMSAKPDTITGQKTAEKRGLKNHKRP